MITINPDLIISDDDRLQEAKDSKSEECEQYAQGLIDSATSNPQVGINVNVNTYKRRLKSRRAGNTDKVSGEIPLTQDEKDQAKVDQKLSEYETKCWDASDKAIKEVNKGTDPVVVMAMNVSTLTTWPIWSPPV